MATEELVPVLPGEKWCGDTAASRRPVASRSLNASRELREEAQVREAMCLLGERFSTVENDGPHAYANFPAGHSGRDERAQLRREAVAVVRAFLATAGF